jgi:hypothetical protein
VTPRRNKLAFIRRNARQNPDGEQITPVTDPEKILKARGSFKTIVVVYQLEIPSLKAKSPFKPSTSLSPRIPYPSSLDLPLREEIKYCLLIFQNPLYNSPQTMMAATGGGGGGFIGGGEGFFRGGGGGVPLGGGGGVPLGGGVGQGHAPPPRFFAKFAARYAPLVLPIPLHDLPENYIKNLPKFTGEGDMTASEHINFFDQFIDIFGIEHEDVYSRLLVQNFEGQVRTWFRSLPATSIPSYDALEDAFLNQWGE